MLTNADVAFLEVIDTIFDFNQASEMMCRRLIEELPGIPAKYEFTKELLEIWREKLRQSILNGTFRSFRRLAREVIASATRRFNIIISPTELTYLSSRAITTMLEHAEIYDDVIEGVRRLYNLGIPMYIVSNMDNDVVKKLLMTYNMSHYFKGVISADITGIGKPNIRIYQAALKRSNARSPVLISGLVEDVVGSRMANITLIFVNRRGETLSLKPDYEVKSVADAVAILEGALNARP